MNLGNPRSIRIDSAVLTSILIMGVVGFECVYLLVESGWAVYMWCYFTYLGSGYFHLACPESDVFEEIYPIRNV